MELRIVDPKILIPNPDNPRKMQPGELPDEQLIANIKEIGIIQPPVVRRQDDKLIIIAGDRRTAAAIAAGLSEIFVLVRDNDAHKDKMRSLSENVVRADLNPVDQWRHIEALSSDQWTEEAIATTLALPVRTIKKLRLLAHIHPPMLDYIAKGDMPKEQDLRTITAATGKEQASVWKVHKPKKGQDSVPWYLIVKALSKRHMLAMHASFGAEEQAAFGITWEVDLFAPADEDSRYTTDVEAFLAAQTAWLENHLPKNAVILSTDEYSRPKLPPKAEQLWKKPTAGDSIGKYVDPRSGEIREVAFRLPKPEPKKRSTTSSSEPDDELSSPGKRGRPDITQKGNAIIGDFRTQALETALLVNPIDDSQLLALLILTFGASNVDVRSGDYDKVEKRREIVSRITEGGHLTDDIAILHRAAREMLAAILSCRTNHNTSGTAARIAGDTVGADAHLPNMATEEFLSCLSKAALEKAAAGLGVPPSPRAKETRAALIEQAGSGHFVHPGAQFAPSEAELATFRSRHVAAIDDEELEEPPLPVDPDASEHVDDSNPSEDDASDFAVVATDAASKSRAGNPGKRQSE